MESTAVVNWTIKLIYGEMVSRGDAVVSCNSNAEFLGIDLV